MARSADEHERNARKYGRRQAVLRAAHSAQELLGKAKQLLAELKAAGAPRATVSALARSLDEHTDVTRRRAAVWAIVDALEAIEARR